MEGRDSVAPSPSNPEQIVLAGWIRRPPLHQVSDRLVL